MKLGTFICFQVHYIGNPSCFSSSEKRVNVSCAGKFCQTIHTLTAHSRSLMYVLCHNRMLKEAGHLPNGDSTAKLKKKKKQNWANTLNFSIKLRLSDKSSMFASRDIGMTSAAMLRGLAGLAGDWRRHKKCTLRTVLRQSVHFYVSVSVKSSHATASTMPYHLAWHQALLKFGYELCREGQKSWYELHRSPSKIKTGRGHWGTFS